jgi:hypothetical protein
MEQLDSNFQCRFTGKLEKKAAYLGLETTRTLVTRWLLTAACVPEKLHKYLCHCIQVSHIPYLKEWDPTKEGTDGEMKLLQWASRSAVQQGVGTGGDGSSLRKCLMQSPMTCASSSWVNWFRPEKKKKVQLK